MKQNFTVRQGALDGVAAFPSVALHRSFRKAAAELGVTPSTISPAVRGDGYGNDNCQPYGGGGFAAARYYGW